MPNHYKIMKIVICYLSGQQCDESYTGKRYTRCENCDYYKDWKQSGLTLNEWKDKLAEYERENMWR